MIVLKHDYLSFIRHSDSLFTTDDITLSFVFLENTFFAEKTEHAKMFFSLHFVWLNMYHESVEIFD